MHAEDHGKNCDKWMAIIKNSCDQRSQRFLKSYGKQTSYGQLNISLSANFEPDLDLTVESGYNAGRTHIAEFGMFPLPNGIFNAEPSSATSGRSLAVVLEGLPPHGGTLLKAEVSQVLILEDRLGRAGLTCGVSDSRLCFFCGVVGRHLVTIFYRRRLVSIVDAHISTLSYKMFQDPVFEKLLLSRLKPQDLSWGFLHIACRGDPLWVVVGEAMRCIDLLGSEDAMYHDGGRWSPAKVILKRAETVENMLLILTGKITHGTDWNSVIM